MQQEAGGEFPNASKKEGDNKNTNIKANNKLVISDALHKECHGLNMIMNIAISTAALK
jgi:hypothetical protein